MRKKIIPKFKSEQQERRFWESHDSSQYVDWTKAKKVTLSALQPSTTSISLRLPRSLIEELRLLAHKKDVPYQSLMKIFLAERVKEELV
jgi:predicted DNA binding CopG/RHH family protein